MALFEGVTTVATVAAVAVAGTAFVPAAGPQHTRNLQTKGDAPPHGVQTANPDSGETFMKQPVTAMREKLGASGMVAYGAGAGVLAAVASAVNNSNSRRRVRRRAAEAAKPAEGADIEVAEKPKPPVSKLAYLEQVPDSICAKETIESLMNIYSKKELEDPPEDSYLYTLKLYAMTYGKGPGKSTKMGWYDFYNMRFFAGGWGLGESRQNPEVTSTDVQYMKMRKAQKIEYMTKGILPMLVPGPTPGLFPVLWQTGATFKWRGPEPFAGDQTQSLIVNGKFAKDFLKAFAWYRDGLKPWQRGIEIGMAHGYFIIGPFTSLGPLRNTPEAATVGLLAGIACIAAASLGGLGFSTVMKPSLPWIDGDKKPGEGFTELVNWHLVGGIGGAGFAHALITIFGS